MSMFITLYMFLAWIPDVILTWFLMCFWRGFCLVFGAVHEVFLAWFVKCFWRGSDVVFESWTQCQCLSHWTCFWRGFLMCFWCGFCLVFGVVSWCVFGVISNLVFGVISNLVFGVVSVLFLARFVKCFWRDLWGVFDVVLMSFLNHEHNVNVYHIEHVFGVHHIGFWLVVCI